WLAQANHIFNRLGITSNHRDYGMFTVYTIPILRRISHQSLLYDTGDSISPGYLFLCPFSDLQSDSPSRFRRPQCPAYWSLDPSGVEHLGMEEAEQLGFPAFELEIEAWVNSWDESVYKGIHQFHQAKGFNPDSLDMALKLEYQLYQLSADADGPFAHGE
ncbi:hypothetical protein FB451DRAFT_1044192, partial [Mycena latifolia]